jgi:predicted dehydrogenase
MGKARSRRSFIRSAAGLALAPALIPVSALGRGGWVAPADRITLGLIGCGSHGLGWNLDQVFPQRDARVVAVCDVDRSHREAARVKVDEFYARDSGGGSGGCAAFEDFRELIDRTEIDAVMNCTPDHWHVIPAIMAARAGKDVMCEKPLTLTVREGIVLRRVIEETGRIFQTASENRSIDTYLRMCELVRNGVIGRLRHIRVSLPSGNESRGENFLDRDERPVPDGFNYDLWLGQAPVAPYVPARCHGSFRWIRDYSGGRLTDWGAHLLDLAQWANDTEHTGPVEVQGEGKYPPQGSLFNTAYEFRLLYRYSNGVSMEVVSEGPGIRFEGTDGWIGCEDWRGPLEASSTAILEEEIGLDGVRLYRPGEIVDRDDHWRGGEHRDFLDGVKTRRPCYAPVEIGHRTITIAHIGNIAMELGRKLGWDPGAERFVDDSAADALLSRPQREPWNIDRIAGLD